MGLFDGNAKEKAAEEEVMRKLSTLPILDDLIATVMLVAEEKESWIRETQTYYDNRLRTVSIKPDSFEIKWSIYEDLPGVGRKEEVLERVGYSYTSSGYLPLHRYVYDGGKKEIPTSRICVLWACVVRERMAAKMQHCEFSNVNHDATFTYKTPMLRFRDWF